MKFRLSIRVKLFLSILLAILASYLILLLLTIRQTEASLNKKINRDLETNLAIIRYHFHSGATKVTSSLLVPVSRPKVKTYLMNRDAFELSGILASTVKALPFLQFADFADPDGRVLASNGGWRSGSRNGLEYLVKEAIRKREPVVSYEKAPPGLFLPGRRMAGGPDAGGEAGRLLTVVAIPVFSESGEPLGALLAGVAISKDMVVPYRIQKAFGHELEISVTTSDLKVIDEAGEGFPIPASGRSRIIPVLAKGSSFKGEVRIGDNLYQAAFEPINSIRGDFVGALSVAVSKEYFNKMLKEYLSGIIASAIFGILIAFGIAFAASRRLSVPLRELSLGVKFIESGNLDYRVAVAGNDEFAMLAKSFNRMAEALQDRNRTIGSKTLDLEVLNRCLHEMNELLETKVLERTSELQMEKGRLEAILTSMAEGVVVTDRDNRVIVFNSAAQKIFGMAPYKMIGRLVDEIDVKGGFHQLILGIRDMRSGDLLAGGEKDFTIGRKKLRVNLSPLLDRTWEFAGIVMSVRDVTHEDEIDRMKTEFVATVSHELKTPLTSMKGSLQLILSRGAGLQETERELIAICLRNSDRLMQLINDILDISRLESGKVDFQLKPRNVAALVASSVEEVAGFAREHGVAILNECTDSLPPVLGDQDRLVQVLTNLISNAVNNSPPGKSVVIRGVREDCFIRISVVDHGKTVERRKRDRLFHIFSRLREVEAGERNDSGLGLVLCREIMERHHGKIFYQAGDGGGNIFTIAIPASEEKR